MTHPPSRSGRRPAISRRARLTLALLLAAGALLACGGLGSRHYSAVTLTNAPASALKLFIYISPDSEKVKIEVSITDTSGNPVNLRNGQRITCNGVAFPSGQNGGSGTGALPDEPVIELAPQPPSGDYTFVYTDERGRQTKLVVPNLPVQMLSPRAGDVVPIPQPASRIVGTPAATPTPLPADQHLERAPDQTASLVVRYTLPALPSGAGAGVSAYARWSSAACPPDQSQCDNSAPCAPSNQCGYIRVDATAIQQADAAGTRTVTIADFAYLLGDGFESFQPEPGRIGLYSDIQWDAADSGFAGAHLAVDSRADAQITWVRS